MHMPNCFQIILHRTIVFLFQFFFSFLFSLSSSILFFFLRLAQPKISNMVDDNLTMELGEKVNVSCEVTGNPPPSVKWVKRTSEGEYVPVVNRGKENRTLLIKSLRQQHYGDYICVAENKFGHDSVVLSVGKCAMVRGFLCGSYLFLFRRYPKLAF